MVKVQRFFKRETKQPFTYPSIEERRNQPNYFVWVMGVLALIAVGLVVFFLF